MDRRSALKNMSAALGVLSSLSGLAGLTPESVFAEGQSIHQHLGSRTGSEHSGSLKIFDGHQNQTVMALSELIIPETNTPGAKAAMVNEFIDTFLTSVPEFKKEEFLEGLRWIDARSRELFKVDFVAAKPEQQNELLTRLSVSHSMEDPEGVSFFNQIKSFTVFGYYTSKIGLEQELKFEGWIEYEGCTHPEHQAQRPSST